MKQIILIFIASILAISTPSDTNSNMVDFKCKSHEALSKFKKSNKIPGLAFALFDSQDTITTHCFGESTLGSKVNQATLFNIQSISKNITALATVKALQKGLLNLDTPISVYLPSFSVNSCFENHPENRITLRMLLSHTAGFTHEAPVGNNYDFSPCTNEDHLRSIEQTWLKFPAGVDYSYSNLGFDIASLVISQKSGIQFDEYLKSEIFLPLGMISTTVNDIEVAKNKNRTDGNIPAVRTSHYRIPLPGSGAVYTNLSDFIKYTQLLMNYGVFDNDTLINKEGLLEMFTIIRNNYGLGTYVDKKDEHLYINHNGGGYGFSATLLWLPEYNLGAVLLCNKPCNTFDICFSLMSDYIQDQKLEKDSSITSLFDAINGQYLRNDNDKKVSLPTCDCDSIFKPEWEKYVGKYSLLVQGLDFKWYVKLAHSLGFGNLNFWITKEGQKLKTIGSIGSSVLKEYKPGLFLTDDFEILDLQSENMTFRNITILKKSN